MKITIEKEYCDRCKKEIERTKDYYHVFKSNSLHVKFYKLKFLCIPHRWAKDAEITNKYYEEEKGLILCPECTQQFVTWWEAEKKDNELEY